MGDLLAGDGFIRPWGRWKTRFGSLCEISERPPPNGWPTEGFGVQVLHLRDTAWRLRASVETGSGHKAVGDAPPRDADATEEEEEEEGGGEGGAAAAAAAAGGGKGSGKKGGRPGAGALPASMQKAQAELTNKLLEASKNNALTMAKPAADRLDWDKKLYEQQKEKKEKEEAAALAAAKAETLARLEKEKELSQQKYTHEVKLAEIAKDTAVAVAQANATAQVEAAKAQASVMPAMMASLVELLKQVKGGGAGGGGLS